MTCTRCKKPTVTDMGCTDELACVRRNIMRLEKLECQLLDKRISDGGLTVWQDIQAELSYCRALLYYRNRNRNPEQRDIDEGY